MATAEKQPTHNDPTGINFLKVGGGYLFASYLYAAILKWYEAFKAGATSIKFAELAKRVEQSNEARKWLQGIESAELAAKSSEWFQHLLNFWKAVADISEKIYNITFYGPLDLIRTYLGVDIPKSFVDITVLFITISSMIIGYSLRTYGWLSAIQQKRVEVEEISAEDPDGNIAFPIVLALVGGLFLGPIGVGVGSALGSTLSRSGQSSRVAQAENELKSLKTGAISVIIGGLISLILTSAIFIFIEISQL